MVAAKVWNGSSWEFLGAAPVAQVQSTAPSGPAVGQFWLDTTTLAGGAGNGPYVCTSGTRPAHQVGLTIYESDTKLTLQSDGTSWYVRGAFGTLPQFQISDSGSQAVTNSGAYITLQTFTLVLGAQYYRIQFGWGFEWNATANAAGFFRVTANGVEIGAIRYHNQATGFNLFKNAYLAQVSPDPYTGNVTINLQSSADAAGTATQISNISGYCRGVAC